MRSFMFIKAARLPRTQRVRYFSTSSRLDIIKPFYLADIGEGIRECEVIQWFVEPGAHIEEFDKICEVQSDKASVDIPSRFSGIIKKLHYEAGDMAIVGKPLIDIDVEEDVAEEDAVLAQPPDANDTATASTAPDGFMASKEEDTGTLAELRKKGSHASLATPAVRHLSKELNVDINMIDGSGRDGRVTKQDIYSFHESKKTSIQREGLDTSTQISRETPIPASEQQETLHPLTKIQSQMFKTMTRSLQIPHFVYSDDIDLTKLATLRKRLNSRATLSTSPTSPQKLSYLPFIIKALSQALHSHPLLNTKVQIDSSSSKPPSLVYRTHHNIGIAMDTPSGLLVPVIQNVAVLSVVEIASRLKELQSRAASNSFHPSDLIGGTITLSNIGSIGGQHFSPVVVEGQVAILAIGKLRDIPAFDANGNVVKRNVMGFSWGADHRVLDGASVARANECLRQYLENIEELILELR